MLKLPERIREDTRTYRTQVEKFLKGELSAVAFRGYRVPMGIYEQRQSGTYTVRVRIGAGLVSGTQLRRIAQLSRQYGNGVVHVTTRQDIQIHDVKIEQTPEVLENLLEVGLSSRGGGGNTVRNVTACPRAGICPHERFDVAPHALAVAQYLMQLDSSYNLPRKYKIAFSGCSDDCALASVADLGFFAHRRNGMKGFAVYAGGGLGPNPAVAVEIEEFIEEHEIFEVAETVKRLFDAYGDRSNRHQARLRYVLARFGREEFTRLCRKERERVKRQGLEGKVPDLAQGPEPARGKGVAFERAADDLLPEKNRGLYTFRLVLPLGDIPADDLLKIAHMAESCGTGIVRTTQQQDVLIPSVPKAKLGTVRRELRTLSFDVSGGGRPKVVACAGASTCRLGLCLSRGLAKAVADTLTRRSAPKADDITIRISGCPNSCGQHFLGDIGFQGHAKRVNGRLMPCYDVLAGAQIAEGAARLADPIGTLPAKRIPEFVAQALQTGATTPERLRELVQKHAEMSAEETPEDYYRDWGCEAPFSLASRGPGECGAGVMDVVRVDIDEARQALKHAGASGVDRERSESLYRSLLASARALLVTFGLEPKTDRGTFEAFHKHLIEPGWVEPATQGLLDDAIDWRMGDNRQTLAERLPDADKLIRRIEELFLSLDANLKFRLAPIRAKGRASGSGSPVHRVDLRGVPCPLNFVKAKLAMDKINIGEVLEIELDGGEPIQNVPASLAQQGQEIVEIKNIGTHHLLRALRKQ
jgi:sulfite reductase (ferredoxin)